MRLRPPVYIKRGKTDAADAEAICEAVTRPTMRFVLIKSREQQAALCLHRTRSLLVEQRTQMVNMIRGQLAEFGVDIPRGLDRALLVAGQVSTEPTLPRHRHHERLRMAALSARRSPHIHQAAATAP